MKSDSDTKEDVERELRWDPDIGATDIGVAMKNGVVTLTGFVRSYSQKLQAEADAKHITGVVELANDIEVHLPTVDERLDSEIVREAVTALKNQMPYTAERIKLIVKDGWITLEGEVAWVTEEVRPVPKNIYGVTKVAAEDLCELFLQGDESCVNASRARR